MRPARILRAEVGKDVVRPLLSSRAAKSIPAEPRQESESSSGCQEDSERPPDPRIRSFMAELMQKHDKSSKLEPEAETVVDQADQGDLLLNPAKITQRRRSANRSLGTFSQMLGNLEAKFGPLQQEPQKGDDVTESTKLGFASGYSFEAEEDVNGTVSSRGEYRFDSKGTTYLLRQTAFGIDRHRVTVAPADGNKTDQPVAELHASMPGLSYTWLRDHCHCPQCVQPSTSQKLHRTGDIYRQVQAANQGSPFRSLKMAEQVSLTGTKMVKFSDHPALQHDVVIPTSLLDGNDIFESRMLYEQRHWDSAATLLKSPTLRLHYQEISKPSGLYAAVQQLTAYGLVVIQGVPTDKTDNKDCTLRDVANLLGEIRNTFYGETWDVKSVANSKNIAYTDVDLGLHQDLCYFQNPPRYQALHCLRNRVDGGGSYFVDSYAAAARLFHSDPHAFETLRKIPMPFIYDNDGYHYRYQHPTIQSSVEVTPSGASALNIEAINYSPPFQGTWKNSETSIHGMDALPKSLHAFEQCLDRDEAKYEFTMQEGDLVLFDNRRVLHARRCFRDRSGEAPMKDGEATRWLKGCYLDGDVVRNKLRVLTRSAMQGEFRPRPEWTPWLKQAGVLSGKVAAQSIDDTDSTEDSQ